MVVFDCTRKPLNIKNDLDGSILHVLVVVGDCRNSHIKYILHGHDRSSRLIIRVFFRDAQSKRVDEFVQQCKLGKQPFMVRLRHLMVLFYSLQNSCGNEILADLGMVREVKQCFVNLIREASVAFFAF